FEAHRPLYDWFLEQIGVEHRPRQIEFARLNLTYTVMSKRLLNTLVKDGLVSGWDDPRMPTIAGLRRRGFTPEAIRLFCDRIGVAKADSTVEVELLQNTQRELLNVSAKRALCVHRPLKVIVENWEEGRVDEIEAPFHPDAPDAGSRKLPFTRELLIECDDFAEVPPKGWKRLSPGKSTVFRGGRGAASEVMVPRALLYSNKKSQQNAAGVSDPCSARFDLAVSDGGHPLYLRATEVGATSCGNAGKPRA